MSFPFNVVRQWKIGPKVPALVIGILVFTAITIIVYVYARSFFESNNNYQSFIMSLAASFLEDAIFFFLIGAIATYISIKDPSGDHIEKRVRWLFNGSRFDQSAIDHIRDQAVELAIYSPEHTVTIEFKEVNDQKTAVKAEIRSHRTFANLMSDAAPAAFQHEYRAVPDMVYSDEPNGELVAVYSGKGDSKRSLIDQSEILPVDGIKRRENIKFEKNGESEFEHVFWVWYKKGEPFFFHVSQYTAKVTIKVKNNDASGFTVRLVDLRNNSVVRDLAPGESQVYSYQGVKPLVTSERPFKLVEVL